MATGKNEVTLTFAGDTDKLDKAFKRVNVSAKGTEETVEKSSKRMGGALKGFGTAAAAGLAGAGIALFSFAKDSVGAFAEAQEAQTKLTDAFARFPTLADTSADALRGLNTELARKTKFDDDAFASGQAVLAQFGLTGKQLTSLTPLLADFAAKTGRELPDAATTLGKAFLGNTRALKDLGINYKSTGDKAKDIANITALLRAQVGGFAEQQGKTAAGQAAILSNRFGEVKEQVGEKLLPVMLKLGDILIKTIGFIERNATILGPLAAVLATVVAVQWAWNIAMTANPIGLIVAGIALLIGAVVFIATKTTWFQTIWRVAWSGIKSAAMAVWDWLKALPGNVGKAFGTLANIITAPFKIAFNAIARLWNNTVGKLSFHVPDWVPGIDGKGFDMPNIPTFHSGGTVPGPPGTEVLALLQAGERVSPAGGSGGGMTIAVTRGGGTSVERMVAELVLQLIRNGVIKLVVRDGRVAVA